MPASHLTRSVRSLSRLQQIARVLTQNGFGHVVDRLELGRYVTLAGFRRRPTDEVALSTSEVFGRRMAKACNELGGIFVKLGQLLSSRPDLIPADTLKGLRALQDRVDPFPHEQALRILEEELGRPVSEGFREFADSPFASGSIGQVYRAVTHDGVPVVVKVKRPDIDRIVELDMHILSWFAEALESLVQESRIYRPQQIVQEFADSLKREMDYIGEASATQRIGDAFADTQGVRIPKVFWELTGSRVLTLEVIEGVNLDTLLESTPEKLDRPQLARRLTEVYLKQFFELGIYHADPHPGNILVQPPSAIGLIDFGQVGILNEELAMQCLTLLYASVNNEAELIVDILDDMRSLGPECDRGVLTSSLQLLLEKYRGLPLKRIDLGVLFSELTSTVRLHDVIIPGNLLILLKTLVTVTGVATRLDPELDLVELLKPRMKKVLFDRFNPARVLRHGGVALWRSLGAVRSAPRHFRSLLRQLSRGQWQLTVRHENLDRVTQELDRASNRLSFALVIAALIVGSSVVISTDSTYELFGISLRFIGAFGYLLAGLFGLSLLWAIFRSGRLR